MERDTFASVELVDPADGMLARLKLALWNLPEHVAGEILQNKFCTMPCVHELDECRNVLTAALVEVNRENWFPCATRHWVCCTFGHMIEANPNRDTEQQGG
jgi:hypothetical protein